MASKAAAIGLAQLQRAEKAVLLSVLDQTWKEHLLALDQLRQGIHLRGYGQRDPFNEYSREAFGLFQLMLDEVREKVTRTLLHAEARMPTMEELAERRRQLEALQELHAPSPDAVTGDPPGETRSLARRPDKNVLNPNDPNTWHATPRNSPCPCGSGKKYKHCHGQMD